MTANAIVYNTFRGDLESLDGIELSVHLFDGTYTPAATDTDVTALTGEGDATPVTFDGYWDETNGTLEIAAADQWPTFTDSDGDTVVWAVVSVSETSHVNEDDVVCAIKYDSHTAADGWTFQPSGGVIAKASDGSTYESRLTDVEARTVAAVTVDSSGDYPAATIATNLAPHLGTSALPTLGSAYQFPRVNSGGTALEYASLLDEDDMASDSATDAPSQQSVVAYVASQIAALGSSGADTLATVDPVDVGGGYWGYFLSTAADADLHQLVAPGTPGGAPAAAMVLPTAAGDYEYTVHLPALGWVAVIFSDGSGPVTPTVVGPAISDGTAGVLFRLWGDGTDWFVTYLSEYSDVSTIESDIAALELTDSYFHPANPVKPTLHVSKYVTYDPDFDLTGSATHVGGQAIEEGQNLTILADDNSKGGVWTMSLVGAATRATGLGSVPGSLVGNYDHVSYTGTTWAYFQTFRLLGDSTVRGMVPDPPTTDGIFGGKAVGGVFRPDLIATTRSGDNLSVLEADGSLTTVDLTTITDTICVLVLDDVDLLTIAETTPASGTGEIKTTEDFALAEGVWVAQGVDGDGEGAAVALAPSVAPTYLTVAPYTPANSAHWSGDPTSRDAAIDRVAAAVYALDSNTAIA